MKEHNTSVDEENKNLDRLLQVNAKTDPVLAEIWDNKKDEAYDRGDVVLVLCWINH